uniref:Alpha-mannosidase n=1 Tax=Onchocerca volvulus TaxID=6282 RepID=A0A8R1XRC9_ONCVO
MIRIKIGPFLFADIKCYIFIIGFCIFSTFLTKFWITLPASSPIFKFLKFNDEEENESMEFHCVQTYPVEPKTEFNTFDIFRRIVGLEQTSQHRYKVRKKKISDVTEVHVLPFTHVDPGWLKTFNNYLNDTNAILDNMITFLQQHPRMRFMWCEIVYLEQWWSRQNESIKSLTRKFIKNKQLEIVSGSWVMTDEATTFFPSTVDNIIEGQQYVYNELNVEAQVMWSNDPFGHGPSVPYLFTKTGINRGVINRIHNDLKIFLRNHGALSFHWRQFFDTNGQHEMLTHVLPFTHYDILSSCGPDPDICCQYDFKRLNHFTCPNIAPVPITNLNIHASALKLEKSFQKMSLMQGNNIILSVWGDDFRYVELEEWYQQHNNLILLFDYINKNSKRTRIRFGTLTEYFDALERSNKAKDLTLATLSGDFFPYQCALGDYWTGFYTTRPFYKRQERELHSFIRAADLLSTTTFMYLSAENRQIIQKQLTIARRSLALFQHHDAITGTSKNHVMKDYSQRLFDSAKIVENVLKISLSSLLRLNSFEIDNIPFMYNESSSKKLITMDQLRTILIYNNEPYERTETIELLISDPNVIVIGTDGPIQAQIEPYFDTVSGNFTENYLLVFFAFLKALSFIHCKIQKTHSATTEIAQILSPIKSPNTIKYISNHFHVKTISKDEFVLQTSRMLVELNPDNGLLDALSLNLSPNDTERLKCKQEFSCYKNSFSGAYVMKIQNHQLQKLKMIDAETFIVSGPLRQIAYTLSKFVKQRLSVNNISGAEENRLHMQLRIDIRKMSSAELITKFATDMIADDIKYYTDSNGLQLIKRAEYNAFDQPEKNYYPMPTVMVLQDRSKRLSILSNVPHGVRTVDKINFEIMLDRRLSADDGKGLGYDDDGLPVDNLPVNMAFTFVLEKLLQVDDKQRQERQFSYNTLNAHLALQSLIYQPNIFIINGILENLTLRHLQSFPCDVQLLTVRPLTSDIKLRLMVLYRAGIDCTSLNSPKCLANELDLAVKKYLQSIDVITVQKTLLNGVKQIGKEMPYQEAKFSLEPNDFATYLIRFK